METIERVARALCRADNTDPDKLIEAYYYAWHDYVKMAQVAVKEMGWRPIDDDAKKGQQVITWEAGSVTNNHFIAGEMNTWNCHCIHPYAQPTHYMDMPVYVDISEDTEVAE